MASEIELLDGDADPGSQVGGFGAARVGEVDLVMVPVVVDVDLQALGSDEVVHFGDRGRFLVIRTDMEGLDATPLVHSEKLNVGEVDFLLGCRLLNRPVEDIVDDKVGQADQRDKLEFSPCGLSRLP